MKNTSDRNTNSVTSICVDLFSRYFAISQSWGSYQRHVPGRPSHHLGVCHCYAMKIAPAYPNMSSRSASEGPGAGSASTMPTDAAVFIPLCVLRKAIVIPNEALQQTQGGLRGVRNPGTLVFEDIPRS